MFYRKSESIIILPICSCGYVFKNIEYNVLIRETKDHFKFPISSFSPSICPGCHREIKSIVLSNGKIEVEVIK